MEQCNIFYLNCTVLFTFETKSIFHDVSFGLVLFIFCEVFSITFLKILNED